MPSLAPACALAEGTAALGGATEAAEGIAAASATGTAEHVKEHLGVDLHATAAAHASHATKATTTAEHV